MPGSSITCPHCHKLISIDEALSHQISAKLQEEWEAKLTAKETELAKLKIESEQKLKLQLETEKQVVATEFAKKLEAEKKRVAESAKTEATQAVSQELVLLKQQLEDRSKKLDEARQQELELRKKANQLEEDKKAFEIEKQRQLDLERAKIREEAEKKAAEAQQLKMMEKDKQLADVMKANEEMHRKLQQGSQQTQGEVLELELESTLRNEFPMDEILPVAKGVRGADVLQIVKDKKGQACGTILWELKNAQWSDKWLDKLREDQRNSKADLAVLVSINLPVNIKNFSYQKGIWITNRMLCLNLAHALRLQLNQVFVTKLSAVGKSEKMEILYQYLSGNEFQQRVEAIVEAFSNLQDDLEKEKRWFNSKWAKQEKNLRKVIDHTMGMHGDLQSIMGASLPEIKQLQITDGDVETPSLTQLDLLS